MVRKAVLVALVLAAFPSTAAEILVPGDQPDLAAAVAAALPGDVIVVQTTLQQSPVTLDKPLTIVGDPVVNMEIFCSASIQLAGPGSGTVVLQNVNATDNFDCAQSPSPISGGGFDELHVYESTIRPPIAGQTGLGAGGHGIDVTVPFVLLEGVVVEGRGSGSDHCSYPTFPNPGSYAGVHAPGSTVVVLDSDVRGGTARYLCCSNCWCFGFPPAGGMGDGGPGIVANEVFVGGSSVLGGEGIPFLAWSGNEWDVGSVLMECGLYANGPALVTSQTVVWTDPITAPATIPLGGSWTLSYEVFSTAAFLYFGFDLTPPVPQGVGWIFLDPATATLIGSFPTGFPNQVTFPVPNVVALAHREVGFQFVNSVGTPLRPVVGVLRP